MSTLTAQSSSRITTSIRSACEFIVYVLAVLLCLGFAFEFSKQEVQISPALNLSNLDLWVLLLIVLWAVRHVIVRSAPRIPPRLALPVLAWLVTLLDSIVATPDHRIEALVYVSRLVRGVLAGWVVYDLACNTTRFKTMAFAVAGGGVLVGLFGIAEALNIQPVIDWLWQFKVIQSKVGGTVRVSSVLPYATITAMVLELTTPLILAGTLTARRRWVKAALWVGLGSCLVILILTNTRGGMIALSCAFVAMIVVTFRRNHIVFRGTLFALGLFVTVGLLWLVTVPTAPLRLQSENITAWYQAAYDVPPELTARPGEKVAIPVRLTNTGIRIWQAGGQLPFLLGYRLFTGSKPFYEEATIPLPTDVAPGQSAQVQAQVFAPPDAGEYDIQWDMYQVHTIWFSELAPTQVYTHLLVSGVPVAEGIPMPSSPITNARYAPIGRFALWGAAVSMFRAHPLFGIGPDNFHFEYGAYLNLASWDMGIHSNNLYLEWLADTGLIGLVAYLWVLWALFRGGWSALWRVDDLSPWRLALAASLIAWCVHSFVDEFTEFNQTWLGLCIITALFLSAIALGGEPHQGKE